MRQFLKILKMPSLGPFHIFTDMRSFGVGFGVGPCIAL